ncbi:hypothetical protein OROGR_004560 [Orobanche gracilis]
MEDEKLAAYYDDLTRRGSGAARFKQGLGFSSGNPPGHDVVPSIGSALPTASSFLSSFVRPSSPSKTSELEKQAQVRSIQNKLSKKPKEKNRIHSPIRNSSCRSRSQSPSQDSIRDKYSRRRSRSRSSSRDRYSRHRSRSRSRGRWSRRRSRSREDNLRHKYRSRSRSRERSKRQGLPEERMSEKSKKRGEVKGGTGIDYSKLIQGYNNMTPAERVKAKMKLQLSKTAEKDETIGKGSGWERFDFDKDAPLDDEEIEVVDLLSAAEDDAVLVKHIGQSFRFSAFEERREEELKAAHDEAMFGGASHPLPAQTNDEAQADILGQDKVESVPVTSLLSDQVLTMQKGSWRDRARKL